MKKHAIIAFATLAFAALTAIAQYSTMATRAYCDRNRELAAAEAVQELGPQIQPAVSQEVQRIAQDIATNLYPIVVVETNLIIVATQIVDNVISNYTIVSNVLVYSENTYVTNNIIAQTNLVVNMTNSYYVSNYTNIYNNTYYTTNIVATTNITYNYNTTYTTNIVFSTNYTYNIEYSTNVTTYVDTLILTNIDYSVHYTTNLNYDVNYETNIVENVYSTNYVSVVNETNIVNQFIVDVSVETNSYFEVVNGKLRLYSNGVLVWEETP